MVGGVGIWGGLYPDGVELRLVVGVQVIVAILQSRVFNAVPTTQIEILHTVTTRALTVC